MSVDSKATPKEIAELAVADGVVAESAEAAVSQAVSMANKALGEEPTVEVSRLKKSRSFALKFFVDNSPSMREMVNEVREVCVRLQQELHGAIADGASCDILLSIEMLNGGQIQPYIPVLESCQLNDENHTIEGSTPLFRRVQMDN